MRRRPRPPRTAKNEAQDATRITTRTLNRITNVNLNAFGPNGGTVSYSTLLNPLSSFAGANTLTGQYEQFRIERIRVYARPDTTNLAGLPSQVGRFTALYAGTNNTTAATYVDYDSFSAPTEQSFLTRDAMKIRALAGGDFRLIANYVPRCRLSDTNNSAPALYPHHNTTWISTDFADLDWLGLAMRYTCDSPVWNTGTNDCMKVQLFVKCVVTFRGLKKDTTTALVAPTGPDPTILTQLSYTNILSSADIIPAITSLSLKDDLPPD